MLYRWFCGLKIDDSTPHHFTLSRTRRRFGLAMFEAIFHEILNQCRTRGLLEESNIMTDSTLFQANASLDSLVLKEGMEPPKSQKKSFSNNTHISKTDPDASFAYKAGTVRSLKYKAHVSCESKHRIIVAIQMTTGAIHDSQPYLEHIAYIKNKSKIEICEAIADKAYGTGEIISLLKALKINTNIPLFNSRSGSSENSTITGFVFDEVNNQYICPNQKILSPCKAKTETTMFISKAQNCLQCPIKVC